MLRIQAVPRTYQQLQRRANAVAAGEPEAIPYIFYDTQTYVDNSSTSLTFFQTVQTDKTLGNLDQAGTLPSPNFFEIEGIHLDFLNVNAAGANPVGPLNDILLLQNTNRGMFVFNIAGKEYLRCPITALHPIGGAVAMIAGTTTADSPVTYALGGPIDGGFYVGKSLILQPTQSFSAQIQWSAASNTTGNVNLRVSLSGVLHRRVL